MSASLISSVFGILVAIAGVLVTRIGLLVNDHLPVLGVVVVVIAYFGVNYLLVRGNK